MTTPTYESIGFGTGISPTQFLALTNLTALGLLSQSELADRLAITGATTSRLIDRMERDEWVRRDSNKSKKNQLVQFWLASWTHYYYSPAP